MHKCTLKTRLSLSGTSARNIEQKWEIVWETCKNCERQSNTRYNIRKTEVFFIEKANKVIRPPVIRIEGTPMEVSPSLKYIMLKDDKKISFNEHLRDVRRKTQELANKLLQMIMRTYWVKRAFIRTVVEAVVKPAVLYAKQIWRHKAAMVSNKKIFMAAQRPFLRAAVSCTYNTTPTSALQVLRHGGGWGRMWEVTNTGGIIGIS